MEHNTQKQSAVPMRGMRDLLPSEVALRQAVIAKIKTVYTSYGFSEIETPIVERSELLNTGEGGDNEKQTFGIMRRGLSLKDIKETDAQHDLVDGGLRFDLTVPLTRYYANNHAQLPSPAKVFQIGSVFRAERPQKGRYRQFTQCDIDIIGEESTIAERELLLATTDVLASIGFEGFTVRINDRRILKGIAYSCGYTEGELETVFIIIDKLDKVGLDGVATELSEKSSQPETVEKMMHFLRNISTQTDNTALLNLMPAEVDTDAITQLTEIIDSVEKLSASDCTVVFDPTLVRGMGYYTGPIFEITDKDFPGSIAGGGRYDKMIGKYLSSDVPACGFSIGFERIMSLLEERGSTLVHKQSKRAVLYDAAVVPTDFALSLTQQLRAENPGVTSLHKRKKNMKNQLNELTEAGYTSYCLLESEQVSPEFKDIG